MFDQNSNYTISVNFKLSLKKNILKILNKTNYHVTDKGQITFIDNNIICYNSTPLFIIHDNSRLDVASQSQYIFFL